MKIEKITPQIAALYLWQKCEVLGDKSAMLSDYYGDGSQVVITPNFIQEISNGRCEIIPNLRRLESLTGDEANEIHLIIYGREYAGTTPIKEWFFLKLPGESDVMQDAIGKPYVWLYLLSKGFDLFGLIDQGLAKDVNA